MAGITYLTQLLHSLMMMIMLFQGISRGRASLSRISEIMKEDLSLKNGSFVPEKPLKGKIEFQNVSFSYPGDESDTLKGIDLTVEPGETVAVIGSTGSGKSTLTGLIDRFYDVNGGRILIDGVDVKDYDLSTLRNSISYTLQKSELFSMSIADNIRWGRPDADDSEVRAAASVAQADSFISEQPEGYDTLVAEDGRSLSGGQRQRIAIARSVIRNAPIMIFDDSTSALDLTTESRFFRALRNCRPDCTKIIVAQRISTVAGADRIIILDHGRVAAQGKHDQLLESCELYRELYRSQIGDDAVLS
jgi:ATP-binding cassette subfamily B protein